MTSSDSPTPARRAISAFSDSDGSVVINIIRIAASDSGTTPALAVVAMDANNVPCRVGACSEPAFDVPQRRNSAAQRDFRMLKFSNSFGFNSSRLNALVMSAPIRSKNDHAGQNDADEQGRTSMPAIMHGPRANLLRKARSDGGQIIEPIHGLSDRPSNSPQQQDPKQRIVKGP